MSRELAIALVAEADKMTSEALATRATHNRSELRRRATLCRTAAAAIVRLLIDHEAHVTEDGRIYDQCEICEAATAAEVRP